jgi:hypothetical protein
LLRIFRSPPQPSALFFLSQLFRINDLSFSSKRFCSFLAIYLSLDCAFFVRCILYLESFLRRVPRLKSSSLHRWTASSCRQSINFHRLSMWISFCSLCGSFVATKLPFSLHSDLSKTLFPQIYSFTTVCIDYIRPQSPQSSCCSFLTILLSFPSFSQSLRVAVALFTVNFPGLSRVPNSCLFACSLFHVVTIMRKCQKTINKNDNDTAASGNDEEQ